MRARLHLILQYSPQMLQYSTTTNPSSCNKIIFAWILQTDKQHVIYLKLSCLSASSHELSSWQVHELWNPTSLCTAHTGQCVHVYIYFFVPLLWTNNKDKNMSCSSTLVSSTFTNKYVWFEGECQTGDVEYFLSSVSSMALRCPPPPLSTVSLQGSAHQCIFNLYLSSSSEPCMSSVGNHFHEYWGSCY